jgi:hypothetical protein
MDELLPSLTLGADRRLRRRNNPQCGFRRRGSHGGALYEPNPAEIVHSSKPAVRIIRMAQQLPDCQALCNDGNRGWLALFATLQWGRVSPAPGGGDGRRNWADLVSLLRRGSREIHHH